MRYLLFSLVRQIRITHLGATTFSKANVSLVHIYNKVHTVSHMPILMRRPHVFLRKETEQNAIENPNKHKR